jgi:integrase
VKCKPKKPRPEFPLYPHRNGQWAKKIRGKLYYFGSWNAPDAALAKYLDERDDLQAGRVPRRSPDAVTTGDLVNLWLEQADHRREAGDITARTFNDYRNIGALIVQELGRNIPAEQIQPSDFAGLRNRVAVRYAPSGLNKTITVVRMIFRWGWESGLLSVLVKHGPNFKGASKRQMRERRNAAVKRLFSAEEFRIILDNCSPVMRAIVLLAINCGLGNSDLAAMREEHLEGEWLNYPRTKTAIPRRIRLWPETLDAINYARTVRPEPIADGDADILFLTINGGRWTWHERGSTNDEIAKQFAKLLKRLGLYEKRRTFYALRHTLQTIGDEVRDPVAVMAVMGHADNSMSAVYREHVGDDRLQAVTDHVRAWLFDEPMEQRAEPARLRVVG